MGSFGLILIKAIFHLKISATSAFSAVNCTNMEILIHS
jgi:hypothetical protein